METRPLKVLLVAGDEDTYAVTSELLDAGFRLDWVPSYEEAKDRVEAQAHDAYLVDERLGSDPGLALLAEVGATGRRAPVIILTRGGSPGDGVAALEAGADEYLHHDQIDSVLLSQTIRHAIERRRATAALLHSETRFRAAFAGAPIGMALHDLEGRFVDVNARLCRLLGQEPAKLLGAELAERAHPDDHDAVAEAFTMVAAGAEDTWDLVKRFRGGGDSPVIAAVSLSLVGAEGGVPEHVFSHWVDVTEQRRVERRLQQVLDDKSAFLASVGHGLRTPLTAVIGFAELLADMESELSAEERRDLVRTITIQGNELANLVEDFLVSAREEAGELALSAVSVDLRAQSAQVVESLSHRAGSPIRIDGEPCRVIADPSRVRQILRNLVSNALQHGGDVVWIEIGAADGWCHARVRDNGPGVPPGQQEAIFEHYNRGGGPTTPGGMGLGLAVAFRLATMMDGKLVYEHRDGATTFELLLPAVVPAAEAVSREPLQA